MAKQEGWEQMVKPAPVPTGYKGIAYFHLNLRIDQLAADEWDFRIFHYDAAFGPNWVNCFVHGLTRCIGEMASNPTAPLRTPCVLPFKPAAPVVPQQTWVPRQPWTPQQQMGAWTPQQPMGTWTPWTQQQSANGNNGNNGANGWGNGRTSQVAAAAAAAEPPAKMARTESADHQPPAVAQPPAVVIQTPDAVVTAPTAIVEEPTAVVEPPSAAVQSTHVGNGSAAPTEPPAKIARTGDETRTNVVEDTMN